MDAHRVRTEEMFTICEPPPAARTMMMNDLTLRNRRINKRAGRLTDSLCLLWLERGRGTSSHGGLGDEAV
ncbi:hypothetical protein EYF80_062178 [Liparis tanakae]|uniref:Uncharacterized protein n=1 Tax=Liparis tanakae TaxID=230148 RepID=A0A4Z2EFG9_9TELE|nr:hypothetical protein EYF80_062178 [Liparis tanakae]